MCANRQWYAGEFRLMLEYVPFLIILIENLEILHFLIDTALFISVQYLYVFKAVNPGNFFYV